MEIQEFRESPEGILEIGQKYLKWFSEKDSVSGNEEGIAQFIGAELDHLGIDYKIERDKDGNVVNIYSEGDVGKPESDTLLMAHLDKVGSTLKTEITDEEISGRLDDAVGISAVMTMFAKGYRPSFLFTSGEESEREYFTVDRGGQTEKTIGMRKKMKKDESGEPIFSLGARQKADEILEGKAKMPKKVFAVDVTKSGGKGDGIFLYETAKVFGGKVFEYDKDYVGNVAKMLKLGGIKANVVEGGANDCLEFLVASNILREKDPQGGFDVCTLEAHVDNMHTNQEGMAASDFDSLLKGLDLILSNDSEL